MAPTRESAASTDMKNPISTSLCVLSAVFLVWIAFFGPGTHWTGRFVKNVRVRVVRLPDHTPVAGATVLVLTHETFEQIWALDRPSRLEAMEAAQVSRFTGLTDSDGRVVLRAQFPAGGSSALFMNHGSYVIRGQIGVVTDTDIVFQRSLADMIPVECRSLGDDLPEIELTLAAD